LTGCLKIKVKKGGEAGSQYHLGVTKRNDGEQKKGFRKWKQKTRKRGGDNLEETLIAENQQKHGGGRRGGKGGGKKKENCPHDSLWKWDNGRFPRENLQIKKETFHLSQKGGGGSCNPSPRPD